jgi:hypothetical protein
MNRVLAKGQLGVEIFNTVPFPISCFLENADSSIEGFAPPRSSFPKPPVMIPPLGRTRVCDDPMDMDNRECGKLIGNMRLHLKYGQPGNEKFDHVFAGKLHIHMENYGFVSHMTLDLTKQIQQEAEGLY